MDYWRAVMYVLMVLKDNPRVEFVQYAGDGVSPDTADGLTINELVDAAMWAAQLGVRSFDVGKYLVLVDFDVVGDDPLFVIYESCNIPELGGGVKQALLLGKDAWVEAGVLKNAIRIVYK